MSVKKATITWKDAGKQFSTTRIKGKADSTLETVATLKTVLAGYSDCSVRANGLMEKDYFSAAGGGNVDRKGIVTCADPEGEIHKWSIPGYNGTSAQDSLGEHMTDPDLSLIVAAITAFDGVLYSILRSPVVQTR